MGSLADSKMKAKHSLQEVSKELKVSSEDLKRFVEEGVIEYADEGETHIDDKNLQRLKAAVALQQEMGVNPEGIDIILNMREKISSMRTEFNRFLETAREKMGSQIDSDLEEIQELTGRLDEEE